ncbi:MAG: Shikimate dehydrogenase [Firmicutes bacterium ADurb.Bin193]|nr:MAG: Shikimate dehydrogenase [Firmicutes bacterium ADurb.Bin193]
MSRFTPTEYVNSIYDIDITKLKNDGIKVLVLDIDNTLVPAKVRVPTEFVLKWIEEAKAIGLEVILLSNNSKGRVDEFNSTLGLYAIHRAYKPLKRCFNRIMEKYGVTRCEICMIGDQIFTDIWGANNAGVMSILVMPMSAEEGLGIRFKRIIENIVIKKHRKDTYCLIGNPVAHSKSPVLHEAVYKYYGINARYLLCRVRREDLGCTVAQFKRTGVKGFNITVPYKQDIIPFLDSVTEHAKKIGSVNTVKIEGGKTVGYNTDGDGFVKQLLSDNTEIADKRIKMIGAGGSAPALVYALISQGAKSIIIYNRTFQKAEDIASGYENVYAKPLCDFTADECDILINTTSVGLSPDRDKSPVESLDGISESTVVYDIIYSPPVTKFMEMAQKKGCKAYNGLKTLVYQGLIADEIWFSRDITDDTLVEGILREMKDKR